MLAVSCHYLLLLEGRGGERWRKEIVHGLCNVQLREFVKLGSFLRKSTMLGSDV